MERKRRRSATDRSSSRARPALLTFVQSPNECSDMLKTLQGMREDRTMCDLMFRVGGKEMPVHRAVVAASNTALGAMLRSGMRESTQEEIVLEDEDPVLFELLLDFIYAKAIDVKHANSMLLLSLACKYQFESLKDQICEHMASSIAADTCCSIFSAADTFDCLQLREQALTKLFNTFASAMKSQGFLEFTHDQVISVLGSDRILDCDEAVVFEAAVKWLQHSEDRSYFKDSIMSVVRFPVMDAGYLSDVIKVHPIMTGAVPSKLLMEAFEHHALRASGRDGVVSVSRTKPRKRSCSFNSATLLDGHQDAISALQVFGDKLISGSWDSAVKVWNTDTWTCERTLSDHTGTIRSLTACEGKVVSASDDGNIKVWNPDGWSLVRTLEGHTESVNCVIDCLGRLASASDDGTIKLWNTSSWTCEVTVHHGPPANSDAEDEEDGQPPARSACGVMSIVCCGDKLVSASDDAHIKIWNTHSWVCEHVIRPGDEEIWAMIVTEDGWLVSGSLNGTVLVWDPSTWTCERALSDHAGPVYAMTSVDGKVVSAGDTQILVWGSDWSLERKLNASGVWSLAVCKGKLVSGGIDANIKIWT